MKNIITKVISVFITLILILSTLSACAGSGKNVAGDVKEYFSIELSYASFELLKKTVVKNGRVVSIHYYELSGGIGNIYYSTLERRREVFNYEGDKLISSDTFEVLSYDFEAICDNGAMMKKLHQTVYVYDGDRIVRGEVYVSGLPTKSYDEYEYTSGGRLKTVKRYERGELDRTYTYGANGLPSTFERNGDVYELSYNANGNLTKIREKNNNKYAYKYDIKYKNGRPSQIDYSQFITPAIGTGEYTHENTLKLEYTENGDISHVDARYNSKEGPKDRWYYVDIEYDEHGRAVCVTNEADYCEKYTHRMNYNDQGILVSGEYFKVTADGEVLANKYFVTGRDDKGKCLGFVDCFGNKYSYKYDENGRLTEKSCESDVNSYELVVETYEYYPSGVLKLLTITCDGELRGTLSYYESSNLKTETRHYGTARTESYVDSPYYYNYVRVGNSYQDSFKHSVQYHGGETEIQGSLDIPQN